MKGGIKYSLLLLVLVLAAGCKHEPPEGPMPPGGNAENCAPGTVYFQQQVLPIFTSNCAIPGCHDAGTREDDVQLTDYAKIVSTGDVRPGRPDDSEVYEKITEEEDEDRMPPPSSGIVLTTEQKNLIRDWIAQGAKDNSCESLYVCDTSGAITFTSGVQPIINLHCRGCHSGSSPQAGINLTTYANAKVLADNGRLYGAVNHASGFTAMPYNQPKLSECKVATIRKWVEQGTPQ